MSEQNLSALIWSVADLLRGDYKQSDYGKVIMPFTVLRRLDCILEATKPEVLAEYEKRTKEDVDPMPFLTRIAKQSFYNSSPLDLTKCLADPSHIQANLLSYINGFSSNIGDIFERYEFDKQIEKLAEANLLFLVTQEFTKVDLHPDVVSNADMGTIFEELIRKFAELSNETAGEHFTPREVIRLMVDLLFAAAERMVESNGRGTKDFCLYVEDILPHSGGGFFHWYDTKEDLYEALVDDLTGFVFTNFADGEFEEYLLSAKQAVEGVRSGQYLLESLPKDINESIEAYAGGSVWRIRYAGTKKALFDEPDGFPFEIRKIFRGGSTQPDFYGAPIQASERASFEATLSDPMGFFSE